MENDAMTTSSKTNKEYIEKIKKIEFKDVCFDCGSSIYPEVRKDEKAYRGPVSYTTQSVLFMIKQVLEVEG